MTAPLTRRGFIGLCATAAGAGLLAPHLRAGTPPAVLKKRPPNILLLSTDQWHAESFSHCGSRWVRTPQSDRIAASGVSFARSYSTDPVCCPSRSSWITGRMPSEHRVIGNGFPILPSIPDFGQWFGSHGYETVHIGKWHVPNRDPARSFHRTSGDHPAGQYCDATIAESARAYLLGGARSQPFLMHVAMMNPHDICQVACMRTNAGELPVSPEELPPLPDNFAARPVEPKTLLAKVRNSPRRAPLRSWSETDWRVYRWMYYRYCEMVDATLERVLDALEASGERENTLLVYTSDHGEGLGHHGLYTKSFLYESAARVPLIMSFPGRLAEGARDERVFAAGVDLFPTFCRVAGIPQPEKLCGEDLLAQHAAGRSAREALVTSASFGGRMVRDERYKLIRYENDPTLQLFDLVADPGETANLATQPERAKTVQGLLAQLAAFESRLTPFPVPPGGTAEIMRRYRNRALED